MGKLFPILDSVTLFYTREKSWFAETSEKIRKSSFQVKISVFNVIYLHIPLARVLLRRVENTYFLT